MYTFYKKNKKIVIINNWEKRKYSIIFIVASLNVQNLHSKRENEICFYTDFFYQNKHSVYLFVWWLVCVAHKENKNNFKTYDENLKK